MESCYEYLSQIFPPIPPTGGQQGNFIPLHPRKSLRFGIVRKIISGYSSASLRSIFATFHLWLWKALGWAMMSIFAADGYTDCRIRSTAALRGGRRCSAIFWAKGAALRLRSGCSCGPTPIRTLGANGSPPGGTIGGKIYNKKSSHLTLRLKQ